MENGRITNSFKYNTLVRYLNSEEKEMYTWNAPRQRLNLLKDTIFFRTTMDEHLN